MSDYVFRSMTSDIAERISGWKYDPPYDFYNFHTDEETIEEFLNGEFYGVQDDSGRLIGFFCCGHAAGVPGGYAAGISEDETRLDIGLGMNPALTGQGLGERFVAEGLRYMRKITMRRGFRLPVAGFNERAIKVYRQNGFVERRRFVSRVKGKEVDFLLMETQ